MYLGRLQVGDRLELMLKITNTSNVATLPDNVPTVKVYDSSGTLVETIKLPIKDRYYQTALFAKAHLLSSSYSAGRYRVIISYDISSVTYKHYQCFQVVSGGDSAGTVIGTRLYECPQANFIVFATEGGTIKSGRNPR